MKRIYDRTVRELFNDFITENKLTCKSIIKRENIQSWFKSKYPKIKANTVSCHIIRLTTNMPSRIHYLKENYLNDDLFFSLPDSRLRLYNKETDPAPIYKMPNSDLQKYEVLKASEEEELGGSSEFAYEEDLKKYLAKNLHMIEPGLKLYEEDDISGLEYNAGGRYIDILAVDSSNNYVVIELKVSRGYDRVVGQILRYVNWVKGNLADSKQKVRGIIIGRKITEDLVLASKNLNEISLFEYELSIKLKNIKGP
ncbi:MAG: endonuclease NucS domain-containing protein [Victivallales bacterium]